MLRFYAVNTLTGRLLDRLYPTSFELVDPLRGPGYGSLTFAKPSESDVRAALVENTRPRTRWVVAQDAGSGLFVWGGPIHKRPSVSGETVTVSLIDWRGWFYRAPLRAVDGGSGDYIVTDVDQAAIFSDLVEAALTDTATSHLTVPPIILDTPMTTGVTRKRTARQLDGSVGTVLDTLVDTERGIEWWTYVVTDPADPTVLQVHVTMAYPERTTDASLLLEWREGVGGNASDASWPDSSEAFSRVWATGDGEPPDQVWAYDEDPDGTVLWENVIGPLDGVKNASTAFEHAYADLQRSKGRENHAEFTVTEETVGLTDVAPGDRARVVYADGWESVDIADARIVERVFTGAADQPTQQRLVLDLADTVRPTDDDSEPGVVGEEEV